MTHAYITRQNKRPAVMMLLEDYNATEETAYLLHPPANAKGLEESIRNLEKGSHKKRKLIEE